MKNLYKKNKLKLQNSFVNINDHDACGVGFVASMNGKKRRDVVTNGINALKAVWHRGAVDADGKSGDGAGICIEIPKEFFLEKITDTGHTHEGENQICVGMIFLPRTEYSEQEKSKTIIEQVLIENDFYIYGWRQVPVNSKVRAKSVLVEAQAKAGGTQLTSEISIEIQGQDRPAMVAETVSIVFE